MKELLPRPTTQFRRRAWLEFQRALDPLAPPKSLPGAVIRASDSAFPSTSKLSKRPGETVDPVRARRMGWKA